MILYGGEKVSLENGAPSLESVAVALGRIPRFCGHTTKFYPVLGHIFTVAQMMRPYTAIHGFLHDAQEAMFADVPTPMKTKVARNREHRVLERLYASLGLALPTSEIEEEIEWADHTVLIAEAHVLGHPGAEAQWGSEFDERAGALTRQRLRYAQSYLDADTAIAAFNRYYKSALKVARMHGTV